MLNCYHTTLEVKVLSTLKLLFFAFHEKISSSVKVFFHPPYALMYTIYIPINLHVNNLQEASPPMLWCGKWFRDTNIHNSLYRMVCSEGKKHATNPNVLHISSKLGGVRYISVANILFSYQQSF